MIEEDHPARAIWELVGQLDLRRYYDSIKVAEGEAGRSATDPRLLDVEAAATYLGRSKTSIQHMIAAGALPVVRSDRRVFLDRQDLDQWIESNKQAPL